ncbi:MAG: response regulator transcription factor [Gammaproteobacteria bacterium]
MIIRILLVDKQRLFRQSLSCMLKQDPDMRVVGEAGDGQEAFALALERKPHIVLMDLSLPKIDGVQTTRLILERAPKTKILILAEYDPTSPILLSLEAALAAGAMGYMLKDIDYPELLRIIKGYAHGSPVSSIFLTASDIAPDKDKVLLGGTIPLTRRELEVMDLLTCGQRSQEIADSLAISIETVKVHIQHIYRKLGVKNRVEMILSLKPDQAVRAHHQ